jgi:heparosan-N-sulfate-glucuronate 5-epimerase
LRTFARRSVQSALSIGPGYERQPAGSFVDVQVVRGYFVDFRAKTTSPTAAHPEALVPAGLAQLALGWWERHLAGDTDAMATFLRVCGLLAASGVDDRGELLWRYEMPVPKYDLVPPWYSALAQAQAASVFVRAHLASGEDRFAELARRSIAPVLPGSPSGLLASTPDGPVPEEAPTNPPSLILNGWIYALWGLWDVAVGLGDRPSRQLLDESVECLRRTLHRYDIGWWSRYSLYPHRLPDLAKPFYHRLHVDQLEVLHRLTGVDEFGEVARRFAAYDTRTHRLRAVAQKMLFVATR